MAQTIEYHGDADVIMSTIVSQLADDNYDGCWYVSVVTRDGDTHTGYLVDIDEAATVIDIQPAESEDPLLDSVGGLTEDEASELARAEAEFDAAGGRGVELAEVIDTLRQRRLGRVKVRVEDIEKLVIP